MKKNNKVLVFGGSGFLGSHVADKLTENNYDVTIFDKNISKYLSEKQTFIEGNILSITDVESAVKDYDYIYHFAGLSDLNESISIEIKDNGIGMNSNVKDKIFEKFYRETKGNIHNIKGHGLGLSYVKKIIDLHNGTIYVASEVGAGSTFTINLPHNDIK